MRKKGDPGLVREVVRLIAERSLSDECAGQLDVINNSICGTALGSGPDIPVCHPGCQRWRAVGLRRKACDECQKQTDAKQKK